MTIWMVLSAACCAEATLDVVDIGVPEVSLYRLVKCEPADYFVYQLMVLCGIMLFFLGDFTREMVTMVG
jgi:hypothetical protein